MSTLTARQKQFLKGLGHHLAPVVQVGHHGATAEVTAEVGRALDIHELIKVRLSENAPGERRGLADELAKATGAAVAQVIGRVVLLYRARKKDPAIALPGAPPRAAADSDDGHAPPRKH